MILVLALIAVAIILGGFGLLVKGLLWLFLIAVILFIGGIVMGTRALRK